MKSKLSANRFSDAAYEQLKQLIIQVKLLPGSPINNVELMEQFNIGRTPLREALQRLSQEDLVKSIPHRGFFVANISASDPLHVFEVRQNLEALSAQLAAQRRTSEQIDEMEKFLSKAAEEFACEDIGWNLETDRQFHTLISRASRNPFLQQTLDRLFNLTIRVLYLSNIPPTMIKEELENYQHIFSAVKEGNPQEAGTAMSSHLKIYPP